MNHPLKMFLATSILVSSAAIAQEPGRPGLEGPGPPPPMMRRPPMERAFHVGPPGRWWHDSEMAQKLGITSEQQKKMDDIFQQSRLKLIDLHASLQKEEQILEPLVSDDQPDEAKILGQIDRVAQARAELEKANARMLLGIRKMLTPEQWKKLQEAGPRERHRGGFGNGQNRERPSQRPGDSSGPSGSGAPTAGDDPDGEQS